MVGQLRHRLESAWPRLASLRHPSWAEDARRLRRIAREETGITLVVAVGLLGALSLAGGAVIAVSSTNARSAEFSSTNGSTYSLAEAGIAHGLSILGNAPTALVPTLLPSTTVALDGGTATFSGALSGSIWTITSTGSTPNPTGGGASPVTRTLTRQAQVVGVVPGTTPPEWNRLFHNNVGSCLEINTINIPSPVTSPGDICLKNGGKITGSGTYVFDGGTAKAQAQVRAALDASAFDWSLVPAQITIHIARGESPRSAPGEIWLDSDLLGAGPFAWATIQHEYAHQIDFFLFDEATRATLNSALGGKDWCYGVLGLNHGEYGCERFASTLVWAYWPSRDNSSKPESKRDESAAMAPAKFRALMTQLIGASDRVPAGGFPRIVAKKGGGLRPNTPCPDSGTAVSCASPSEQSWPPKRGKGRFARGRTGDTASPVGADDQGE